MEKSLIELLSIPVANYHANALKMKEIANRRYTWKTIARKYANLVYAFDYDYERVGVEADSSKIDYDTLFQMGRAHLKAPKYFYQED